VSDPNLSESLDDDKIERTQYPPDRPLGAEDRGVTDVEDSVDERRRREIPEAAGRGRRDDVGTLVDQADPDGIDDEPDAVAMAAIDESDPLGRDVSVQDLEEVEPAEEAAMHITDEPPMGDGDGYVED
jgi:hypothetical protein